MEDIPYVRVGTAYFKLVRVPSISGDFNEELVVWNIETIRQDHGKNYLSNVPKFDGFTCIPDHLSYQREYHHFYNRYAPMSHQMEKGTCEHSLAFIKHIFGAQYEMGLDYFQILFLIPIQILPILCLVSEERGTGKSTFLKWLKLIFEGNMTFLTNDSFSSQFNSDWTNKLLICIDEVLFNKEELTERIKYLSTASSNKMEAKGKDKREMDFFGKFVLCSNNEDSFIKIDTNENRFWVLKVPVFAEEDTSFLEKLKAEIPAFLHTLNERRYSKKHTTRMWFEFEDIKTPALLRLIRNNRNRVEKEMASTLLTIMELFDWDSIDFCPLDLMQMLNRTRVKTDLTQLRQILKGTWQLKNQTNSNKYQKFIVLQTGDVVLGEGKGRYYSIDKDFLIQNFDDVMTT